MDTEFCGMFEERVNNSPAEIFRKMTGNPMFANPMINKLFKDNEKKEAEADATKKGDL